MTLIALILVQFLFGGLPAATKIALLDASPLELMVLRTGGALLVFGLWAWRVSLSAKGQLPILAPWLGARKNEILRHHFTLFLMALCGASLNQYLLFLGLMAGGALIAAIVVPTIPLFTVLLAVFSGQESFHLGKAAAAILGFIGVLILGLPGAFETTAGNLSGALMGTVLCVLSSLLTAFFFVLKRTLAQRVGPARVLFPVYIYGFSVSSVLWVAMDPSGTIPSLYHSITHQGWSQAIPSLPLHFWLATSFVVMGSTVLSNLLNTWAIKRVPASTVTGFIFLQTLVGMFLSHYLLGEEITLQHGLAAGTIGVSLSLLARIAWRESRSGRATSPVVTDHIMVEKGPGSSASRLPG